MNQKQQDVYPLRKQETDDSIRYFFLSQGDKEIIKVIVYSRIGEFEDRPLFNLGFGDFSLELDEVLDDCQSNNGDHYKVLNTVLSSIPIFFNVQKDAMLMIQGSDSRGEFSTHCRLTCNKNCTLFKCKKAGQRIRIYRSYVEKNYSALKKDYIFWGRQRFGAQQFIEKYCKGKSYEAVFLIKK